MPGVRQSNFSAGELASGLWGRSDLKAYLAGARAINNFIPTYYGSLLSRPGTTYVANTRGNAVARLIPFNSSDETYQNYVIEIGYESSSGYMRFYQNGAPVMNGGSPLEISSPYYGSYIPRLKFVQVGDILTIVHPLYAPRELRRISHLNWTLNTISFEASVGSLGYIANYPGFTQPSGATDATDRPKLEWDWVCTAIDSNGEESGPSEPFYELLTAGQTPFGSMVYKDRPKKLRAYANGAKSIFFYRGRHGLRGFIGIATPDPLTGPGYFSFLDEGQSPDYSKQPPDFRRRLSFKDWEVGKIYYTGDRVKTGSGNVYECIQSGLSGASAPSGTGSSINDGAAEWQTNHVYSAGAEVTANGVKWGTVAGGTSAGTGTGPVWDPTNPGAAVTDNTVSWQFVTHWPLCKWRYVAANSSPQLIFEQYPASVAIFEGRRVFGRTDQEPGDIFASRTDDYNNFFALGKDFSRELNIFLATDALQFELASRRREEIRSLVGLRHLIALTNSSEWSIGGAANGDPMSPISISARAQGERGSSWLDPIVIGDLLIHVQPKGTVIRDLYYDWQAQAYHGDDLSFYSRHLFKGHDIVSWAYAEDPQSVVWVIRDDGQLLSLTMVKEQGVQGWARHTTAVNSTFESVCSIPEGKEDAVYFIVRRKVNGAYVRFIERMATREISDVTLAMCLDAGISYYNATPFTVVSGLSHLNGETVSALADGVAYEGLVVAGGSITLPVAANQVQVGLPYICEFESLDVAEIRERQKIVKETLIDLICSRGVYIAESLDSTNWTEFVRVPASGVIPLEAGTARVTVFGAWGLAGRVALQQRLPMPIEITGIYRELGVGGT